MGYYCFREIIILFKCFFGMFNNQICVIEFLDCIFCILGQFCEGYGNINLDGSCDEGWYCEKVVYLRRFVFEVNIIFDNFLDFICFFYLVNFIGGICFFGYFCF